MAEKSSIFDNIRIKSRRGAKPVKEVDMCEWEGCENPGTHKAPKSQQSNKEFHRFCLAHVRKYNQSFNFFAENKDDNSNDAQRKSAQTGERPTWRMGTNPNAKARSRKAKPADPNHLYARLAARSRADNPQKRAPRRLNNADRRALEVLGLKGRHTEVEIKLAYKTLVKLHHPDANGGDRGSEDRLRAIITAYNHLKQKGHV